MNLRHGLLPLLLVILGSTTARAQTLLVYNVDGSGFPTITANFILFDAQGNRVRDVAAADFTVVEDGLPATDITVECPPFTPPQPFHAVLVNDRSGSMGVAASGGISRIDLAKMGSREFVLMTSFGSGSSIAVTAFESSASIVSDFQTTPLPLIGAINSIEPDGGTLYNPPFLDPIAGAIGMLSKRPGAIRRVIVFLTDGEPNEATLVGQIVDAANDNDVEVYAVTIGMPMKPELRAISDATGGMAFGNVNSADAIRAVYQQIALASEGTGACRITWRSRVRCGMASRNRSVTISHRPTGAFTRTVYTAPMTSVAGIEATPSFAHFGEVGPPDVVEREIVIVSANDSMRVDRAAVVPEGAFTVVDWGGAPPPFVEPPGRSRTIRVRFAPADSLKYVASLVLYGTPCPPYPITLTGGVGRDDGASIRLLSPIGGEAFSGCDSVTIRWGGVGPSVPIDIDYSSDDGATWQPVAGGATGLSYRWMPPGPGTRWRIRISAAEGQEQHLISTTAGAGVSQADDIQAIDAGLLSPTGVAVADDTMYIAEAGMHRVRRVDMTTGVITTVAGTGNPGTNGEVIAKFARLNAPSHVTISGPYLFIADQGNHRVRAINIASGRIITVAGSGESDFGGDDGDALLADFSFPSYLAIAGTSLFVSDAGNLRIRRIDLGSNRISTVAGGGTSTADGAAATLALLEGPAGIAADDRFVYVAMTLGRKIRRIDTRNGTITTIAGTGAHGSTGDGAQALFATFMSPVGVELHRDALYVTDSAAHRVRRIDLLTGMIETIAGTGAPGETGDGGDARLAQLAGPMQPMAHEGMLYVPDVLSGRIRAITIGRGPGSDSSRSAFAVNVAQLTVRALTGRAIDFGPMASGRPIDSTIAGALCSTGDLPLVIDSARVVGTHARDFSIVSGAPSLEMPPGTCSPLEVRFRPSGLGIRTALLLLYSRCANADTVWLSGAGVDTCGVSSLDLADVGVVVIGEAARDTIIERAVCNTDTGPISGFVRLASGAHVFTILEGGGAYTLAPGECRTVRVSFTPAASGLVTGEIDYGIPQRCGVARTRLVARALGSPEPTLPSIVAWSADACRTAIDTTIAITNDGGAPLEITAARIVDNAEGFALRAPIPDATSPLVIEPGATATLALRFSPASPGAKTATLELESNVAGSPHRVPLSGRRDVIALVAEPALAFPASAAPLPHDTVIDVVNDGSVDLEIATATLGGLDPASFEVPAGQFPLVIAPGASAPISIRLLERPLERTLRARLLLGYGPTCDSGRVAVDLIAAGTGPELLGAGVMFDPLVCADEPSRDTTVRVANVGSLPLVVSAMSIVSDPAGAFTVVDPSGFALAPSTDTTIAVRFASSAPGAYGAALRLETNTREGFALLPLSGRRELVALTSDALAIMFEPLEPGDVGTRSIAITNGGTAPIDVVLETRRGIVTLVDGAPRRLLPGESTDVGLRFAGMTGGAFADTLVVRDFLCGTELLVPVDATVELPAVAEVSLPHDTVGPGARVALPMRIAIVDRELFESSGASGFVATVRLIGTVVSADSVAGAELLSSAYDPRTRLQTLVFRGRYTGASDTIATILGRSVLGDTLGTPLVAADFTWDVPTVGARLVNGSVTVIGTCLDLPLRIVAAPAIVKVRPMPAGDRAVVEVALEEWLNVRVVLYDGRGVPVATLRDAPLDAGVSEVVLELGDLPAGIYTLAVESAYGRGATPIVIRR